MLKLLLLCCMQNWFKHWFNSPYYHMLYKNRTQEEADGFVKNCVAKWNWENKFSLLDIACGKGRHAKAFASFGMDVTGIDLSEESIHDAQQFEHDKLHFYVHDMRQIFRANYYDIVTNLFTSFGYFDHAHDNDLAANTIIKALKPGGKFLMDFVNQQYAFDAIKKNSNDKIEVEHVQFTIRKYTNGEQLIKEISIEDGDTKQQYQESVNSFSYTNMLNLFARQGLQHVESFGDYDLNGYGEMESPRMILLFEK
jgi:2-polyprenyl-3-methyl-5-hydroxy-6-metoxy-1,4-benzoquinol methylase